mgnify:CR=1 FL=1
MGPGGARNKGSNGERELALLLTGWTAGTTKLTLTRNLEQTRGGGHDLNGLESYGMSVEVKRVEVKAINSWWAQAQRQADALKLLPVLAWRQNRQPWRFRIRAFVWPCGQPLAVDLEQDEFRKWFLAQLSACKPPE